MPHDEAQALRERVRTTIMRVYLEDRDALGFLAERLCAITDIARGPVLSCNERLAFSDLLHAAADAVER
ncbi:hypothetical protein EI171_29115 [Bradyrhizobium sp. LCT2]|uniref:hypothetical protein n=1 Tax=Bradyrhizobium sp. LCT2 TaxID=2493093 RepID=UPI0013745A19|nr:hypothetical protein [Bradyrhizobium sp. LCT2]QHP70996.1 hypothetical protein EI171_29115 [Bradyrhizobium sp. LCT2]